MSRLKVKLWEDRYAPGMVQARALRDDVTTRLRQEAERQGVTWDRKTDAALVSHEDAVASPRQRRDLDMGWNVIALVDIDTLRAWYGITAD